jgi:hypothetical protein
MQPLTTPHLGQRIVGYSALRIQLYGVTDVGCGDVEYFEFEVASPNLRQG